MVKFLRTVIFGMLFSLTFVPSLYVDASEGEIVADTVTVNWDTAFYSGPSEELNTGYIIPEGTELLAISDILTPDNKFYYLTKVNDTYGYVQRFVCNSTKDLPDSFVDSSKIQVESPIVLGGNIYNGSYEELLKYYKMIPEKIRTQYEQEGFIVKMTEWPIVDEAYAPYGGFTGIGTVTACFDYELKKLLVNDENPMDVIHEMGHYVNDRLNIMGRVHNKELFNTEAARISCYATQNPNEYFAECFDLYIRCPEALKIISPSSYVMINESVYEMENL